MTPDLWLLASDTTPLFVVALAALLLRSPLAFLPTLAAVLLYPDAYRANPAAVGMILAAWTLTIGALDRFIGEGHRLR